MAPCHYSQDINAETRYKASDAMEEYFNEEGYYQLVRDAIAIGVTTPDRTGCGTQKMFGAALTCPDIQQGFPLFTGRPVDFSLSFHELMFFLNGRVQTTELEEKGCNFWKKHTSREFLDGRGLKELPTGHMGYAYGAVMRHAGGTYDECFNPVGGFDQLAYVVDELKRDIFSRRAMIELWSPQDLHKMALTPCCHNYNFCATMGADNSPTLNLCIKVRSSDLPFGLAANAAQFGFLLLAMSQLIGVRAGALTLALVDAHIYSGGYANQIPYMTEAAGRELFPLPQLVIKKELTTLDDLLSLTLDDIAVLNYQKNKSKMETKRPPMAV